MNNKSDFSYYIIIFVKTKLKMKKVVAFVTLFAFIISSCSSSNGSKQGKHHSHRKAKKQASGYFFDSQH